MDNRKHDPAGQGINNSSNSSERRNTANLFSRRRVLQGIGAMGVAGGALTATTGSAAASGAVLGDFESGFDGWKTDGGNELGTVGKDEEGAPVTRGESALTVTSDGDPQPAIRRSVSDVEFTEKPYLLADVLPGPIEDTDSAVTFRFRYHSRGRGDVEESPTITARQRYGIRLAWDMSEVDDSKLSSPKRLELAWYPEQHPPKTGPRGGGPGFDYRGTTYVDNVRLEASDETVELRRWNLKRREMRREYGFRTDKTVDTLTDSVQTGVVVYPDGTEIEYRGEIRDDGTLELEFDGDTFEFRGEN